MKSPSGYELRFSESLAAARESRGLTRRELAGRIGLDPSILLSYEKCRSAPRIHSFCEIADALGCTADELLGREK